MRKSFLSLILCSLLLSSCGKEQDPFQVNKNHVGLLTDSTQVKDLETIFSKDSIVKNKEGDTFSLNVSDIEIFETGGEKLLILTPIRRRDSTSTIKSIQIMDARYKTDKGVSKLSTFKDISSKYKISRIDNLISSIVIFVNDINATFTIDKKELPASLRFDMTLKIEETQIPENAKVKYFFLNWNNH